MKHGKFAPMVIALMCIACLLATPAVAQDDYFGIAGTTEIAGSISFSSTTLVSNGNTSDVATVFSVGPELGYFVADGFEIGFNPGVSSLPFYSAGLLPTGLSVITFEKGSYTVMQLFASAAYNFHLEGSQVNPFLQVPFGYTALASSGNDDTASGFSWGVRGGIKVVAANHLLLTFYGQYLALAFTPKNATGRYGFNYLSVGVSVGGFF